jgi:hypothetical protein
MISEIQEAIRKGISDEQRLVGSLEPVSFLFEEYARHDGFLNGAYYLNSVSFNTCIRLFNKYFFFYFVVVYSL